jgi:hypothetical protein
VLRWDALDHVLREYSTISDTDPDLATIRVVTTGGGEFVIGSGHTGIYQIDREIVGVLVAKRLPAAAARAGSGAPVHFGGLSVSQVGIAWDTGTQWVSWRDIRWIRLTPWQVEIATAVPAARQRIWLNDIPRLTGRGAAHAAARGQVRGAAEGIFGRTAASAARAGLTTGCLDLKLA